MARFPLKASGWSEASGKTRNPIRIPRTHLPHTVAESTFENSEFIIRLRRLLPLSSRRTPECYVPVVANACRVRPALNWRPQCQCCQPDLMARSPSHLSNGFANRSQAPRFRTSAQRRSSASLEVTINDGTLGSVARCSSMSMYDPGSNSRSQITTAISYRCNRPRADARSEAWIRTHGGSPIMPRKDE
jgi:hypothetical protein